MATSADTSTTTKSVKQTIEQQPGNMPDRRRLLELLAWLTVGLVVVMIAGVTFTASAIFLAFATPIFLFFCPVLVPLATFLFVGTAGILSVVGCGLAALSCGVWLYRYLKGEEPVYSDSVDAARNRIASTAHEVKEWARDHAGLAQAAASA